ncbi:Regulator of Vps4 activity in the MVB pathway protein [Zea mays]|uniref:Regulator of Vps4 activity in the MVB pathway protein n=1 Tax=Zea mays TaxID=4577 RepID=A0A1D6L542_MAIZE|nr:Regulator of Vps4 activity in the MVB pathway protein [Zea mays]
MGFFQGKTSKQTTRVKKLLGLALSRLTIARRPRLARRSICRSDVGQLLSLGYLHHALLRAEQVIEEDNMLQAFDIIELCCKRLVEHAAHLDKPQWCGDLPELQVARTILEDKFGSDMAVIAKEGTSIVDPMLVWKLSGDKTNMELKKKVTKEIAVENSFMVDFSELQLQEAV